MSVQINESFKTVSEEAAAGAAVYSNLLLSVYDIEVLIFELQYIFKCPLQKVVKFFNENVSGIHLDVGVGTGYFLDKCNFPVENPIIHLMDLNSNTLRKTSKRLKRYEPVPHQCNVLEPIQEDLPMFDSISAVNFLHCLPGTMLDKEIAIKNLKPFLREGGVFFGVTVLGQGVDVGILYRIANSIYNKKSIFSNLNDNVSDLEVILKNHFRRYSLQTVGSVAFFSGHD
jgi:SAM-dependent methyltransferase